MAISINFADFDTVCYSNQHNIIELIKHAVGISIEINTMATDILTALTTANEALRRLQELIDQLYNSGGAGGGGPGQIGELQQLVEILRDQTNDLNLRMNSVYEFSFDFRNSVTGSIINNLQDRVTALENRS